MSGLIDRLAFRLPIRLPLCIRMAYTARQYSTVDSRSSNNAISRKKEELLYQMGQIIRTSNFKSDKLGDHNNYDADLSSYLKRCNQANHLKDFDGDNLPSGFGSNQNITIDSHIEHELQIILSQFQAPIDFAFGYGSGVFKQNGYEGSERPQIDLILGVEDPIKFHEINMKQNPIHYSSLKWCGPTVLSRCQDIGAGIYFNPFVTIAGYQVKYGVVSLDRVIKDLSTWDSFYLAGRLHKPVKILRENNAIKYWNQLNLKGAATVAKHLLRSNKNRQGKIEEFNEFNFYKKITGLSYLGDIRYTLGGENPNKVNNIIDQNFHNFQIYYKPIYEDVVINDNDYLPLGYDLKNCLKTLERNIRRTSILQTLKGILTAGAIKSVKYAWSKKMKVWRGK
ncbi:phosphatidate cytidylyltransferase, mitochondrial [Monosporozyma servazzii]